MITCWNKGMHAVALHAGLISAGWQVAGAAKLQLAVNDMNVGGVVLSAA